MPDPISPRTILVTGSSRGIGRAIAVAFAREGAHVIGLARSAQDETAAACAAAGGRFTAFAADFGSASQAEAHALVASILAQTGRIDALVNNAGTIRRAPAVDFPEAEWEDVLRTNLTSPFYLTQAVVKWWLKDGGLASAPAGARLKIVNIASLLSFQGGITVPAYAASKHGIAGLTKALANEWAKHRINVNAIAPGYIATDNTAALRADAARNEAILARIPEGRWGEAEDIAGTCVYLASPAADYVNGAVLNVDGGWLGR